VLDKELAQREHLARSGYSIADIAAYPWVQAMAGSYPELFEQAPHVQRWLERVGARPAVQRGMDVPKPG
jgi:GST-like protein